MNLRKDRIIRYYQNLKRKSLLASFKIFFEMLKTIDFVETKEGSKYVERK